MEFHGTNKAPYYYIILVFLALAISRRIRSSGPSWDTISGPIRRTLTGRGRWECRSRTTRS